MSHLPRSHALTLEIFKIIAPLAVALAALGLQTKHCFAQASVIEALEAEGQPATDKHGNVETDILPSEVIIWNLAGHQLDPETNRLKITLSLSTKRQFTIYADKLKFEPADGWKIIATSTPKTERQYDPISRKEVDVYTGGAFDLTLELAGEAAAAELKINYVGCTRVICLFPHTEKISVPMDVSRLKSKRTPGPQASADALSSVSSAPPLSSSATLSSGPTSSGQTSSDQTSSGQTSSANSLSDPTPTADTPPSGSQGTVEEEFARRVKTGQMGFLTLLLIAFAGGLLTNLTPCVAPMIPITIRLLANQTSRPITSASMYASGIVATYTTLGVIAALSGALFGNLIAHPAVSVTFGLVMFVLGLNMLGFGDLSKLQQIGGRIGSSKGGAFNAFLMGAGAGLVASPCTGPILAALLTYTAGRQNMAEAISLLGVYSIGFALPYVFLGASAARISKVRVSFHVQILTKLVFASVMFGLSLYFLRIPLYGVFTAMRPYWSTIGILGSAIGLITGTVIILRDTFHHRKALFLAPTMSFGCGLFFGIQALTRGAASSQQTIAWLHSEQEAFEQSRKTGKPIIVDAWAEWCEACKKMDVTTFAEPDVISEITARWTPLKFDLTESSDSNNEIQERYQLPGLPTLTLLPPGGALARKIQITGYASAPSLLEALRKHQPALAQTPRSEP